jgi:hypothetical protein
VNDEAANQGGLVDLSEDAHSFDFRNHAITERLCVGHAVTCKIDDARCDDFPVVSLTVDVERGAGRSRASDIAVMASGSNTVLSSR